MRYHEMSIAERTNKPENNMYFEPELLNLVVWDTGRDMYTLECQLK